MKPSTANEIVTLAMEAWGRDENRLVDVTTLAQSLLGIKDEQGQPMLSDLEMKHPAAMLMLNQLAHLLREITDTSTDHTDGKVGAESKGSDDAVGKERREAVTALKQEIARLNKVLAQKEREIKNLKRNR